MSLESSFEQEHTTQAFVKMLRQKFEIKSPPPTRFHLHRSKALSKAIVKYYKALVV